LVEADLLQSAVTPICSSRVLGCRRSIRRSGLASAPRDR
jgi:hypothetical protein